MRYPVNQRIVISSHIPFGGPDPNAKYGRHAGDDSANSCGTEVYAPANGTVTGYTTGTAHGNVVEIFDGQYYLHVFHLSQRLVSPGQKVNEGQLIGKVGTTGLSTGCHVHFGVSKRSIPQVTSFSDFIDPLVYIKGEPMDANEGDLANIFEAVYALPVTQADKDFWLGGGKKWTFKNLFYAVKDSQRYRTEHFINDGDIANLKAKGIDLTKVKGKMWKDGIYNGASGIPGVPNREAVVKYVQDNLK